MLYLQILSYLFVISRLSLSDIFVGLLCLPRGAISSSPRQLCANLCQGHDVHNCFGSRPLSLTACKCVSVCVCVSVRTAIKTCFSLDIFNVYFATAALNLIYVNSLKRQLAGCVCTFVSVCVPVCVCLRVCLRVCLWVCLCFTSFSFYRYFIIIKRISFTFMQLFLHLSHSFFSLSLLLVVSYTIRKSEHFFSFAVECNYSPFTMHSTPQRERERVCVDRPANTSARCKAPARYM